MENTNKLILIKDNKPIFTLISSPEYRVGDIKLYRPMCDKINAAIKEVTGIELPVVNSGDSAPSENFISIGTIQLPEDRHLMKNVRISGYILKTAGTRLYLDGWVDHSLTLAVDRLIEMILQCGKTGELIIDAPDITDYPPIIPQRNRPAEQKSAYGEKFVYTYYYGPTAAECTEELVKLIAEAGITRMQLQDYSGVEKMRETIKLAEKYNMDVSFFPVNPSAWSKGYNLYNFCTPDNADKISQEEVDTAVSEIVDAVGDLDNVVEWYITDEPIPENAEGLRKVVDAFHRLDPKRPTIINYFPGSGISYDEYLDAFTNVIDLDTISYDRYKFYGQPPVMTDREYLDNLCTLTEYAKNHSFIPGAIVLLSNHSIPGHIYSALAEEQIRWEVNMVLAYGSKSVSFFTVSNLALLDDFSEGEEFGGMFDLKWQPTQNYYSVKAVAKDTLPVGDYLVKRDLSIVYHLDTIERLCAPYYIPYGVPESKLGMVGGSNAVISIFDDSSVYFTNYTYDTGAPDNVFTLEDFDGDAIEWYDPTDRTWKAAEINPEFTKTDKGYKLALPSGDAVLFRIV